MARARGTKSGLSAPPARSDEGAPTHSDGTRREPGAAVGDLLRRAVSAGLAGVFGPTEVVRKAVEEAMPKDWIDFASEQSERARRELVDRVASELARSVAGLDLVALAEQFLEGREIEVSARIRLHPKSPKPAEGRALRVAMRRTGDVE